MLGERKRLLIFIVAYNAAKTIENVLARIPSQILDDYASEVLIIDDASTDETFSRAHTTQSAGLVPFLLTILRNPANHGYGANQKIGFHYAGQRGFDYVALVHGDGQYAPEYLLQLVLPLATGEADAVLGSRMLTRGGALKGGMPVNNYVGNRILPGCRTGYLAGC